jgi:tRNA-Thr(GGU) m(6)t(6)A37 methyltransferase TsaA
VKTNPPSANHTSKQGAHETPASFEFHPIGWVNSPYKEKFGTPRQPGLVSETKGSILLRDDLNPDSLEGLSDYSHAWIVFVFHENESVRTGKPNLKTKVHPPRLQGKSIGVFATRSPHRPNPIGLSLVAIERIVGRHIHIRGLDVIDGTPVLDIKPYLPSVESLADAHEGWSAAVPVKTVDVEWSPRALQELAQFVDGENERLSTRGAIEKILELDPRPVAYRGTADNPDPYTKRYGFRFKDWNVIFVMLPPVTENSQRRARIEGIEAWPPKES